jgi:rubrerythrin
VCVGWDKEKKKMRWQNEVTAIILYQAEDFEDWYRDDDEDGCIRYRHARTGRTADCTQPDPRFEKAEDSEAVAAVKDAVKSDLSMGVYLCSSLMEEYYKTDDIPLEANKSRHQRRVMEKILTQPGYIKLRQSLKTARMIYTEEDFQDEVVSLFFLLLLSLHIYLFFLSRFLTSSILKPINQLIHPQLCVTGDQILKQYEELVEYGKYQQEELKAKKKTLLKYKDAYQEKEVFHCPTCNRLLSGMPKMCGVCGGKIPNGLPATPKEDILEDGSRKPGTATWTQHGPPVK